MLKEMRNPTKKELDEILEKLEEQKARAKKIKKGEYKVLYNEDIDAYVLIPDNDKTTFSDAEVVQILNNVVKTDRELRHEVPKINIYKYTTIILIIALLVKTFIIK